ncbi:MAG: nitroreductase/quinone reductase family protein [Roseiflexaceae bacterium]
MNQPPSAHPPGHDPRTPWWFWPFTIIGATRFGGWFMTRVAPPIDRVLFRLTRGRLRISLGLPSLILTTIGAKSGEPRTTPLVYLPDRRRIILIASNGGNPNNPAWYYNLKKNPRAKVLIAGHEAEYIAHEASGQEREQLWQRAAQMYAGYDTYQARANQRIIPVVILSPVEE